MGEGVLPQSIGSPHGLSARGGGKLRGAEGGEHFLKSCFELGILVTDEACRGVCRNLHALGLSKPYSCTLIPNDETATTTLRKISPFIFYGLPSADTVRRLFLTRQVPLLLAGAVAARPRQAHAGAGAQARMQSDEGGPPVPLSNNVMIEDAFGSMGILCLEDLVEHILTCGPHFAQLMQKVGKFQLTSLKQVEGLEAKRMEYGFLGDKINIKVTQLT
ncbi:60s ribosomal protein [Cyclospora cayetanensis]|uniref:60s ribosomal protein n=1 Tax=Cyclospora cayetanensis TaxID=88456 RepID=A0A1D3D2G6_9EIME|nr:60s ribosomal protein [Cyclospora cayetanensis]